MSTYIILAIIAGVPVVLALVLRVSAVFLYLGVAAGLILSQYIAQDTSLALNAFFAHSQVDSYVRLVLLLLPVLLTLIFLRKTLPGSKFFLHVVPLIITNVALGTFIMTNLPGGVQHQLVTNPVGRIANSAQNLLITASTVVTLLLAWLTMRHKQSKKH